MLGFNDVVIPKKYLRVAGLQQNAKLVAVKYDAAEYGEYFDIELETADGATFKDRTFIPTAEKVFPKKKYSEGKEVGEETKEEAFKRAKGEIITKLFHLGLVFEDEATLRASITAPTWKELIAKFNKVITMSGKQDTTRLNFLTVWKNNDNKKSSNLIIPDRTAWVEVYTEGKPAGIKLSKWQLDNQMIEKYPYQAGGSTPNTEDVISGEATDVASDLPF